MFKFLSTLLVISNYIKQINVFRQLITQKKLLHASNVKLSSSGMKIAYLLGQ